MDFNEYANYDLKNNKIKTETGKWQTTQSVDFWDWSNRKLVTQVPIISLSHAFSNWSFYHYVKLSQDPRPG